MVNQQPKRPDRQSKFRGELYTKIYSGTAELKATKEDTSGTEIGWFTVFTTDRDTKNPILLISMVENVKDIGGSGYVVEKDKAILDEYLGNE